MKFSYPLEPLSPLPEEKILNVPIPRSESQSKPEFLEASACHAGKRHKACVQERAGNPEELPEVAPDPILIPP